MTDLSTLTRTPDLTDLLFSVREIGASIVRESDRAIDAHTDEEPGRVANALACLQEEIEGLSRAYNRLAWVNRLREVR